MEVVEFFFFFLGFFLVYLLYKISCENGNCKYKFNQIRFGKRIIHFHHWISHLIGLIIYLNIRKKLNNVDWFVIGCLTAGIAHGIYEYDDWFVIIK
jgi:hypothetical protein